MKTSATRPSRHRQCGNASSHLIARYVPILSGGLLGISKRWWNETGGTLCGCVIVETGAGPRPALGMLLHHALSSAAGLKYLEICEDRSSEVA